MTKTFRNKLRRRLYVEIRAALDALLTGQDSPLADAVRLILGRLVQRDLQARVAHIETNPVGAILAGEDGPGRNLVELIAAAEELGAVGNDSRALFEVIPAAEPPPPPAPTGLLRTRATSEGWEAEP